jgi:hypothetical protein
MRCSTHCWPHSGTTETRDNSLNAELARKDEAAHFELSSLPEIASRTTATNDSASTTTAP